MKKILICLAMFGALTGCGGGGGDGNPSVIYSVSGSATSASVTYQNSQGGTSQETVKVPWSKQINAGDGDFLYISAQNNGQSGSITADISVSGKPFRTTTSSGGYVIATASGRCC